jgi:plastocyanin
VIEQEELAVRRSLLSGLGAGFTLIMVTACGGTSATPAPPAATAAPPAATQAGASQAVGGTAPTCGTGSGQAVAIVNFSFSPGSLSASPGSLVTWTNNDSTTHTVTFDNGPDCGSVAPGAAVTATFLAPGTYAYHCKIHPTMKGTVTVS